jgi:hypothetical protein
MYIISMSSCLGLVTSLPKRIDSKYILGSELLSSNTFLAEPLTRRIVQEYYKAAILRCSIRAILFSSIRA